MLDAWISLVKEESLAGLPDNFPIQQKLEGNLLNFKYKRNPAFC